MRRLPFIALAIACALVTPTLADPAQDAAQANGPAVYALVAGPCTAETQGRLPFAADNGVALAAAGLSWVRQPAEWLTHVTAVGPGEPRYAQARLPAGTALLTAVPGRLCQVTVADAPTGRWVYRSLEIALHADGGWLLQSRADGFETTSRRWLRAKAAGRPAADLRLREFLDGGGPERHTRLILTLQTF